MTRLYIPAAGPANVATVNPPFSTEWAYTTNADRRIVYVQGTQVLRTTGGWTINPASMTSGTAFLTRMFVSPQLPLTPTPLTISGTFSMVIGARQGANAYGLVLTVNVFVTTPDGLTKRGNLLTMQQGSALTNSTARPTVTVKNAVMAPVVAQGGDRLVIEVGSTHTGVTGPSSAEYIFGIEPKPDYTLTDGQQTQAATGTTWMEFSQTLWPIPTYGWGLRLN